MRVSVVWANAQVQDLVPVDVPEGSSVAEAVARSGLVACHGLDPAELGYAIYGRRAGAQARVADGDRIELTRTLTADPKELRRRRARDAGPAVASPRPRRGPGSAG